MGFARGKTPQRITRLCNANLAIPGFYYAKKGFHTTKNNLLPTPAGLSKKYIIINFFLILLHL